MEYPAIWTRNSRQHTACQRANSHQHVFFSVTYSRSHSLLLDKVSPAKRLSRSRSSSIKAGSDSATPSSNPPNMVAPDFRGGVHCAGANSVARNV